jgi:hypothetical protein
MPRPFPKIPIFLEISKISKNFQKFPKISKKNPKISKKNPAALAAECF